MRYTGGTSCRLAKRSPPSIRLVIKPSRSTTQCHTGLNRGRDTPTIPSASRCSWSRSRARAMSSGNRAGLVGSSSRT